MDVRSLYQLFFSRNTFISYTTYSKDDASHWISKVKAVYLNKNILGNYLSSMVVPSY